MNSAPQAKGPVAWMASNAVAANLLMLFLLLGGLMCAMLIKQEVFPDFTLDEVEVSVEYSGASPEEVEQGVVLAIEEAVQGLEGVDEVTSTSSEGSCTVTIEALKGANIDRLLQDVKSEVDSITSFPDEAEEPIITVASHDHDVLSVMLYGRLDELVLRELAEQLRTDLLSDTGITKVELAEVSDLQVNIEPSQDKLRALGLTLEDVADTLRNASVDLPGGGVKTASGEVLVRMKNRKDYAREFARTPVVTTGDGSQVLLSDIAKVSEGFEDSDIITTYDGKPAVRLDVYRVGDQTPNSVAQAVQARLENFRLQLPKGVDINIMNDKSITFNQRMELLLSNGFLGLVLVFFVLALFLDLRLAFWVAMGIPVSFLGSFLILGALGVSINMITMFAFLIALGIVVDDAIVVGENVYTLREQGMPPLQAAIRGTKEISGPVVFSVLTNIVAFVPMLYMPGVMGKVWFAMPIVVISVFSISLIESLFILPAHLAHMKQSANKGLSGLIQRGQKRVSNGLFFFIHRIYRPLLDRCSAWRYLTIASGLAILILSGALVASGRLGFTLSPRVQSDYAYATAELPYGSPVANTKAVRDRLLAAADEVIAENGGDRLSQGVYAKIGGAGRDISGSHVVTIQVYLTDAETRPISTQEFVDKWRQKTGTIPGLENILFLSDKGGPGGGNSLEIQLAHRDVDQLKAASSELAQALSYFPKVSDIDDGYSLGKQQIDFTMTPQGESLGLDADAIASQIRAAYEGVEVVRQQRGRNEIKVVVRRPESERISEFDLEEFIVRTPDNIEVPLRNVVNITRGRAFTVINHVNGQRSLLVTADVTPDNETSQVLSDILRDTMPQLQAKYPGLSYSIEGKQGDMAEGTSSLFSGLILAMLVIFALLAIPFKSYTQPAIVMCSIPFGAAGAIIGHALLGYSISLQSLLGIVALSGVVVNDSLVFIDCINQLRAKGINAYDAVLQAGTSRFRPIMLTTLTTFGGLAPMIMETSRQAQFLIPMAVSLGVGILFATGVTLILVPSLYLVLEDIKALRARIRGRKRIHAPIVAHEQNI